MTDNALIALFVLFALFPLILIVLYLTKPIRKRIHARVTASARRRMEEQLKKILSDVRLLMEDGSLRRPVPSVASNQIFFNANDALWEAVAVVGLSRRRMRCLSISVEITTYFLTEVRHICKTSATLVMEDTKLRIEGQEKDVLLISIDDAHSQEGETGCVKIEFVYDYHLVAQEIEIRQ